MKTIIIAITNRSSYNKVKTVIEHLLLKDDIQLYIMLGGSVLLYKYGSVGNLIGEDFPSVPILNISLAVEGDSLDKMSKTVGLGVIEISTIFSTVRPDFVVTVADRFETLATAIAASYTNIPLIHLQGGETTGSIDDKVRNAITQLADYHFTATELSAYRVGLMKMNGCIRIYPWGCPSMDLLKRKCDRGTNYLSRIINETGTGEELKLWQPYMIIMFHSDTNDIDGSLSYCEHLLTAANEVGVQKVIFWNNIDSGGEFISKLFRITVSDFWGNPARHIRQVSPEDFGLLLSHASCIVGNSSSGIREASFMGTPSLNVGCRQDGRERASNVLTVRENSKRAILTGIEIQLGKKFKPSKLYGNGKAGERIANTISTFTG